MAVLARLSTRPERRHTRRTILAGAALASALAVTACGGTGSEPAPSASPGSGESPVTVTHQHGETTVPATAERVVSVGFTDQDPLLALGVVPVGIRDFFGDQPFATWPWARELLGGAEPEVLAVSDLNYEQIAALRPDLIISTSGLDQPEYDTLSDIAPTVAQSGEYADNGMPWQERTTLVGQSVGEQEQAQELVDSVEAQFADARAENPRFADLSIIVASPSSNDGEFFILGEQDRRVRFFTDLGFTVEPGAAELVGDLFTTTVSGEQLGLLDEADIVVWNTQDAQERAVVESNPVYNSLAVAREGRAVFLPEEVAPAVSFATVLSLPVALDAMVPLLSQTVRELPPR